MGLFFTIMTVNVLFFRPHADGCEHTMRIGDNNVFEVRSQSGAMHIGNHNIIQVTGSLCFLCIFCRGLILMLIDVIICLKCIKSLRVRPKLREMNVEQYCWSHGNQ